MAGRTCLFFCITDWTIVPVLTLAFGVTGLMIRTPDLDENRTLPEESFVYHEHQGDIDTRVFFSRISPPLRRLDSVAALLLKGRASTEGAL